jgi:membrane-associated phospholipid phosphatase
MRTLFAGIAQYAIGVVALVAAVVWLRVPRTQKLRFAAEALVALAAVAVLVKVAGALHTDVRPFVADPHLRAWFAHTADDGFPSDHTALAFAVALVVLAHRRTAGVVLVAVALAIGAARVLAHVHHLQDIGAALLIGAVAAGLGLAVGSLASRYVGQPTRSVDSRS